MKVCNSAFSNECLMRAIDYVATAFFDIHDFCVCISHAYPHTVF